MLRVVEELGSQNVRVATANEKADILSKVKTQGRSTDGRGNLASESRPGLVGATTAYDGHGRLTGYARSDAGTLSFVYNGQDDRVGMSSTTAGTRTFVYDADGRVLAEYGASAADVRAEFVWTLPEVANDDASFGGDDGAGGYMPLAVATPDGSGTVQLNWVHGNHLGVPLVTTDTSGAPASTPNDYLAPGFPSQSRTLADLSYSRHRDYDPTTGRYIQADPIGLAGGQNGYVYAANNPIKNIDPLGQNPLVIARAFCMINPTACAAAGAAVGGAVYNLFRGPKDPPFPPASPPSDGCDDNDDGERCKKVMDTCHERCRDLPLWALPGTGRDRFPRYRGCMRECMEKQGCSF